MRQSLEVARLDLRLRRRMFVGTAVGAALYLFLVVAMFRSFQQDNSLEDLIRDNSTAAALMGVSGSISTAAGWLGANMYANFGPLLALTLTIGYGARAIAGENEEGWLGLTLVSSEVGRGRILLQKVLVLVVAALVVPVASALTCLVGPRFGMHLDWGPLLATSGALTLMAADLGAVALLVGALGGSRGLALGVASSLAGAAYLISSLAPAVHVVHRLRWVSPFFWSVGDSQLVNGVSAMQWTLLAALGVVLAVGTAWFWRRTDLS